LWIEGKLWFIFILIILILYSTFVLEFFCREFTYEPPLFCPAQVGGLKLQITKKHSSAYDNNTAAEIIFWYWNDKKEIVILHVGQGD
jgi:hypothetical protein